jgi:hypothetical protein
MVFNGNFNYTVFNSYIIPTELILKLKGILSWMKKEPKKDIFMKILKVIEVKV